MTTTRNHATDPGSGLVAVGTTAFAGVMLATVAIFQILQGFAAVAKDTVYVTGVEYTYELDVTTWGWVHLILGVLGVVIGVAILGRQDWGLISGIVIAALAAIANFAFLPYYPWWSLAIVAFNALVIWALCAQLAGGDRRP